MRVSVYTIYVVACLLASGAAIVSGIFLINTFAGQQREAENTQLQTGSGQVRAVQSMVATQMLRMQKSTEATARAFFYQTSNVPADGFAPDVVMSTVNATLYANWIPNLKAPDQLHGHGMSFVYFDDDGQPYDRSFQVYWDLLKSGKFEFVYAFTSLDDGYCHAWKITWPSFSSPRLAEELYAFDALDPIADTYKRDNFYDSAKPWAASDGNAYWSYAHLQAFYQDGMWINFQTWGVGIEWLDMMTSVLTTGANIVAFDSQRYVMAATEPDELARLAKCRALHVSADVSSSCINTPADMHPIPQIREVYTALYSPTWDALGTDAITPSATKLTLNNQAYMAIAETLFSKDNLRVTVVWYQPWVSMQGDCPMLLVMVCSLTVLSTFVLTLLGIFGVLRPMMALGGVMRDVVHTLQDGATETVLDPLKSSVFYEVDAIGRDCETIVSDFLGFSGVTPLPDVKYAPKDRFKPFAAVCLDIALSTELWDRDPAEMFRCVHTFQELVQQLVPKHLLYEVRNDNDAFLLTATTAGRALRFALALQTTLCDHDWGWPAAEEVYGRASELVAEAGDDEKPGASQDCPDKSIVWNGLRCRVGIHFGVGELRYDDVADVYDYSGPVVDTAARIRALAHGGQVLVSQAVLNALPAPLDPAVGLLVPLGSDPFQPALVDVRPPRLRARAFPPLPAEADDEALALAADPSISPASVDLTVTASSEAPLCACGSSTARSADTDPRARRGSCRPQAGAADRTVVRLAEHIARSHTAVQNGRLTVESVSSRLLALYNVVEALLRPLAAQQYATVARALARGWKVPVPRTKADFPLSGLYIARKVSESCAAIERLAPNDGVSQSIPPIRPKPAPLPDSPV